MYACATYQFVLFVLLELVVVVVELSITFFIEPIYYLSYLLDRPLRTEWKEYVQFVPLYVQTLVRMSLHPWPKTKLLCFVMLALLTLISNYYELNLGSKRE